MSNALEPPRQCTGTPSCSSSGTSASFHGSTYATSSSKNDRSRRLAKLTRSLSAPPRPRPLVSHRIRAVGVQRSEQLDVTKAQIPLVQ